MVTDGIKLLQYKLNVTQNHSSRPIKENQEIIRRSEIPFSFLNNSSELLPVACCIFASENAVVDETEFDNTRRLHRGQDPTEQSRQDENHSSDD